MSETREAILARIQSHLPFNSDPTWRLLEDADLTDIGVDSMHLLTLLLALHEDFSLDIERIARFGMPTTVRALVTLIEQGLESRPQ